MTTLTERLRELEVYEMKTCGYHSPSLELAQELHALLVECGEVMLMVGDPRHERACCLAFKSLFIKLQQAGIV